MFEMAKRLKKMPGLTHEEIDLLTDSMKRVIVVTIEKLLQFSISGTQPTAPQPYYHFGQILNRMHQQNKGKNEISILTFNYDIAADYMLHELDLGTTGIVPFNRFWVFDPDESGKVEERFENLLGPGATSR